MIAAGAAGPDFTLRDQDGEKVSLADFRGRKLLLVFPRCDSSPVCGDQLSIYQEVKPEIDAKGSSWSGSASTASSPTRPSGKARARHDPLSDFEPKGEVAGAPTAPMSRRWASPTAPSS